LAPKINRDSVRRFCHVGVTSTVLNDVSKSSVVLDRELDEEKSREPSDPRIRCPLCGWSRAFISCDSPDTSTYGGRVRLPVR